MLQLNKLFRNQHGFSLIELMVALAILSLAALGIFQAYSVAFQSMTDAKYRTIAANIAQKKLEEIKNSIKVAYPYYSIETQEISGQTFTVVVATADYEEDPDLNLKEVYVTVSWRNRKGETKDVQLQTRVYDLETIIVTNPDVGRIALSANPTEVTCCVEDEFTTITAEVFNTSIPEERVPSGTPVSFEVISGDGTVDSEFSVTDASGKAYTQLTVNNLGPANVQATSGLVDSDPLEVTCTPEVNEITLEADPPAILPGDKSVITATVFDTCGDVISEEVTVEFTTDDDSDIYFLVSGNEVSTTEVNTVDGKATIDLYIDTSGKTATVTGTVLPVPVEGEPISGSTTVFCTDYSISVSANPTSINPGGDNDYSTIIAQLTQAGGSIPVGKTINFTTDLGSLSANSAITDGNGQASVILSSLSSGDTATITASYTISGENTISDTTSVRCTEYVLTISANPEKVIPGSPSTVSATLRNYEGSLVPNRLVEFYTTKGILSDSSVYTNINGIAETTLTLNNVGDIAQVTATIGFANESVTIQCIEFILEISANPTSISPGENSTITALLTDYMGTPQSGETISFTTDEGTFTETGSITATAVTNGSGEAVVHLTLNTAGSTALVTAAYDMVEDTVEVSCFETYITLNTPANINTSNEDRVLEFDLRLYGGPLTVDKVKIEWVKNYWGNPSRYNRIFIERPIGDSNRVQIYQLNVNNYGTIETLNMNAPFTIPTNSIFRMRIRFISDIDHNHVTFTFNPDDPGAEENYKVEFNT